MVLDQKSSTYLLCPVASIYTLASCLQPVPTGGEVKCLQPGPRLRNAQATLAKMFARLRQIKVLSPKSKNQIQKYQNPKPQPKIRNHQRIDTTKSQTLNSKPEIQNDGDGPNELPLDMGNFVTVRKLSGARFPQKNCKSNLCESGFIFCLAQLRWNMRSLTLLIPMAL